MWVLGAEFWSSARVATALMVHISSPGESVFFPDGGDNSKGRNSSRHIQFDESLFTWVFFRFMGD